MKAASVMPLSMMKFIVPEGEGNVNPRHLFPGKAVSVDPIFGQFLEAVGRKYRTAGFACRIYQTQNGGNTDDYIINAFGFLDTIDGNRACALLSFLGSSRGPVFSAPRSISEMSLILGYIVVGDVRFVLYFQHEYAWRTDKINLCATQTNRWGNATPAVVIW